MSQKDINDQATEEVGSTTVAPAQIRAAAIKSPSRSFLQVARRDLSEEELSGAAARRFLIADIERLEQENGELKALRSEYYEIKTSLAVLQEKDRSSKWSELLSFTCLSVGSAGLGAAPSYIPISSLGWVLVVLSLALFGAGIASRVWK